MGRIRYRFFNSLLIQKALFPVGCEVCGLPNGCGTQCCLSRWNFYEQNSAKLTSKLKFSAFSSSEQITHNSPVAGSSDAEPTSFPALFDGTASGAARKSCQYLVERHATDRSSLCPDNRLTGDRPLIPVIVQNDRCGSWWTPEVRYRCARYPSRLSVFSTMKTSLLILFGRPYQSINRVTRRSKRRGQAESNAFPKQSCA